MGHRVLSDDRADRARRKTFAYSKAAGSHRGATPGGARRALEVLVSDDEATFDRDIEIDAGRLEPMITWGTSPQHAVAISGRVPGLAESGTSREAYERALAYMDVKPGDDLQSLAIGSAFIGSCTNSRISDLRRAAAILRGRRIAPGVRAICVPGSMSVKRQAEAEGLDRDFVDAGFEWRESGCSMCFYAGGESFGRRERVVSSTIAISRAARVPRRAPTSRARKRSQRVPLPDILADPRRLAG